MASKGEWQVGAKQFRMNRLFQSRQGRSGRCLDVAVDHGFFNESKFLEGIEDIRSAVLALAEAGPDAIQLTIGQAGHLQSLPGREKPVLVLRTDVANVYGRTLPGVVFSHLIANPVEQALRLDAVCVVANIFSIPGQPDLHGQCIRNIMALQPECERFGMPLMVEPLIFAPNDKDGGYMPDGNPEMIIPLVRQAVELGADIIKADPTRNPEDYHKVIAIAGKTPVLVRGGGRAPDAEILARTGTLMRQGAAGIVYGRNIIQHPNPKGMVRALMAMVHDGATPDEAAAFVRGKEPLQRVPSRA
ncbi:MAG: deoxyribose-phosphate aldolase/phospho-2-dehydro-3-deoxyheptonate aldolase [Fibrobacteres bacterium]|nr:deoxyribose-phosphate aldolase/phospho-2-dehydro-3-deoxyheptonate aldolase [Fibrobacterota bacterium]